MKLSRRARFVFDGMSNPNTISYRYRDDIRYWREYLIDGEWFVLTRVLNVGKVTIAELLSAKLIEGTQRDNGLVVYRLTTDVDNDFGDLWVS
jgi:hypothetical protein